MTSPVKYFHDGLPGAPVLSGTAGSRKAILDACLVTGWGVVTLTGLSVSAGVATATVSAGHPFEPDSVALIAGAATPAVNGEHTVTATATGSFTFAAPGVADGAVSGTITAKLAPAGWTKAFDGTNKAAYKSAAPSATGCYFRVDDSAAKYAQLRGYESMTDVDTGTAAFPTVAQAVGAGLYVPGSNAADATARKWMLIADDRFAILLTAHHSSYINDYGGFAFGDFASWRNPDVYNALVIASASDTSAASSPGTTDSPAIGQVRSNAGTYLCRKYTQLGGAIQAERSAILFSGPTTRSGEVGLTAGPSPVDSVLYVLPMFVLGEANAVHGQLPGLYFVPANLGATFDSKAKLAAPVGLPGRKLVAFRIGGYVDPASSGRMFVDITGPWR